MPRLDVGNHGGSFRKDLNGGHEIGERQEAEPDSPRMPAEGLDWIP